MQVGHHSLFLAPWPGTAPYARCYGWHLLIQDTPASSLMVQRSPIVSYVQAEERRRTVALVTYSTEGETVYAGMEAELVA